MIQGPGENAGVIDIGDGLAAIFKMESHNHPSFIEPYQGAATGVGGILRDVFTMGARPIANLNALRFGSPDHPKTRHLVAGVVAGIGGYGNCVGVPTVGGEVNFHPSYNGNILVNAMTVGLARADQIFYSAAAGVGNPVVYVGSKTGRDGIHGATMASAEFDEDTRGEAPDRAGRRSLHREAADRGLPRADGDRRHRRDPGHGRRRPHLVLGRDGSKGGLGIELDLDHVPTRETGMTPYEIMLSESQERMLMVLKPGRGTRREAIFEKWELDFAVIGHLTDTGHLVLKMKGEVVADMPVAAARRRGAALRAALGADAAAAGDRCREPCRRRRTSARRWRSSIGCPDLASKRWIWEQYDHLVMGRHRAAAGRRRRRRARAGHRGRPWP